MISDALIAALIGIAGVIVGPFIVAAIDRYNHGGKITQIGKIAMIIVAAIIISVIAASIYVSIPSPSPFVEITNPTNGTIVNLNQIITGESSYIPADCKVWIVLHVGTQYFSQPEPVIDKSGSWTCNATFGGPTNGGLGYDIIALVADKSAQGTLTPSHEIFVCPPDGATIYHTIKVTRNGTQSTPTPILSPTPTPSPTPAQSPTPIPTPSSSPTPSPTFTPTFIPTFTPTPTPSPTPTPTPGIPSIAFTYPTNSSQVNINEWASGTSQNIPSGQQLWIVVHQDTLYFPMVDGVQINTDHTWTYNTTIGQSGDTGKIFDIIAVLANNSAQSAVQAWYQHPYDLTSLLPGMTQYSIVTVTRR